MPYIVGSPYNWLVFRPLYKLNNQDQLVTAHMTLTNKTREGAGSFSTTTLFL